MELIQPLLTSTARYAQPREGKFFVPDFVKKTQERYRFWQVPKTPEEYSRADGAEFSFGVFDGENLDALRLFSNGAMAEGKVHSDLLDAFLDDFFAWAGGEFGIRYEPLSPVARTYSSTVEVRAPQSLGAYLNSFSPLAEKITAMVSRYGFSISPYEFTTITAITDPDLAKPLKPGRFLFDRRAGQPLTSDVYFSEAPVSTDEHMDLLQTLELILGS